MNERYETGPAEWEGELFRMFAENVQDCAILLLDLEGRVQGWTPGAERLLGYREGEILGQLLDLFYTPEDREAGVPQLKIEEALLSGRGEEERWHVRQDGSRFWASGSMTPLRDRSGKIWGFAQMMRDRTEWQRTEQARRESEASKAAVLETALDGIITITHEDRIVEFNAAAERLFGHRRSDVLGQKMGELIVPPRLRAQHYRGMAHFLATGEERVLGQRLELPAVRADGTEFPVELAIVRVPSEQPTLFTGYIRDLSDRKAQDRRGATQLAVTEALAGACTLEGAARRILEAVCEGLGWEMGAFWVVDGQNHLLRCLEVRQPSASQASEFERATREKTLQLGVGLPGRVWLSGRPLWLSDIAADENFPRVALAARDGLRSAFAVPLVLGEQVLGVTEFFSRSTNEPDADLLTMMAALGGQVGQFMQRIQAEANLRESEERFRAFMDNTPALAWLTDAAGNFVFANSAYYRAFDIPATGLAGRNVSDLFSEQHAQVYLENIRKVAESGTVLETVEAGPREDGGLSEFLVYKFPLVNSNGTTDVGGVAVDVTERRQMEETLRMRDRAISAATQGILITDPALDDNPIIYASPGFERLTGYTSDEVLGRNCRFLQGADTDPEAKAIIRGALRAEEPCTVEILNYRKDGTQFWNELSISPVRDASGRLTQFIVVQSDVTERRRLEQHFQHAQKMEAVGQLAGGIAHDFNNLLTIILGYCEALLEQSSPEAPEWEPLEEIRIAGERSANLTGQLLAFSRRQVLRLEVLDLNIIVGNTEKMLRRLIGEDIQVVLKLTETLLPVRADAGQLEQILVNLAVNARDAMPAGGRLTIETRNVELDRRYVQAHLQATAGTHVMLAVSDTGCGMSPAVRSRIFEPFFTTKKVGQGTGLGLSVVYGIVNQLDGHIEVASQPARGTTFKIFLPCRRESLRRAEEPTSPESRAEPLPQGTETVLLVEDEAGVRGLAKRILQRCGYTVLEASHGQAVTQIVDASAQPIDLLVTDVVMPGESGPQIADRLSKHFPAMKVLFISGYTDDTVVRHGVMHNKVHFLQKPFSPLQLASHVREVLDAPGEQKAS